MLICSSFAFAGDKMCTSSVQCDSDLSCDNIESGEYFGECSDTELLECSMSPDCSYVVI